MYNPKGTSWLWWTALLIAAGAFTAIFFIQGDPGNVNADDTISAIIAVSIIAIGLCVISATAHWWMNR